MLSAATGTRTYTNRFGVSSSSTTFTVSAAATNASGCQTTCCTSALGRCPFDTKGLTAEPVSSAVQLPGHGPNRAVLRRLNAVQHASGEVVRGRARSASTQIGSGLPVVHCTRLH